MAKGWERFDFDKDAPLDNEDEEIEGKFPHFTKDCPIYMAIMRIY